MLPISPYREGGEGRIGLRRQLWCDATKETNKQQGAVKFLRKRINEAIAYAESRWVRALASTVIGMCRQSGAVGDVAGNGVAISGNYGVIGFRMGPGAMRRSGRQQTGLRSQRTYRRRSRRQAELIVEEISRPGSVWPRKQASGVNRPAP